MWWAFPQRGRPPVAGHGLVVAANSYELAGHAGNPSGGRPRDVTDSDQVA